MLTMNSPWFCWLSPRPASHLHPKAPQCPHFILSTLPRWDSFAFGNTIVPPLSTVVAAPQSLCHSPSSRSHSSSVRYSSSSFSFQRPRCRQCRGPSMWCSKCDAAVECCVRCDVQSATGYSTTPQGWLARKDIIFSIREVWDHTKTRIGRGNRKNAIKAKKILDY